jgi:hypothetical protein
LKTILKAVSLALLASLASCAYYIVDPSQNGTTSYRDRPATTGSNLTRKGTVESIDAAAVQDALRHSSIKVAPPS